MDSKKRPTSGVPSYEKNSKERKPSGKNNAIKREKAEEKKPEIQVRTLSKVSMIPKLKLEKNEKRDTLPKTNHTSLTSKSLSTPGKAKTHCKEYDLKLKSLQAKEKSIAEYYKKMEDLIQNLMKSISKNKESSLKGKNLGRHSSARKMTSDPLVFNQGKVKKDVLSDFEKDVQQISDTWSKTSADLSNTIKSLKNNPTLDPLEFEVESVRIQLAVKQAKSMTLIKTRNVIAEAKKLMLHREMIRAEIEKVMGNEGSNFEQEKLSGCEYLSEKGLKNDKVINESKKEVQEVKIDGTGDSGKPDDGTLIKSTEVCKNKKEIFGAATDTADVKSTSSLVEEKLSSELLKQSLSQPGFIDQLLEESKILKAELKKKNETITHLNSKIFQLQKTCHEDSLKYNQLQVKLAEHNENIQWNHLLWKQIGKLKEKITELQLSNQNLQAHNKELESKIAKLGQELEKLMKMNSFISHKNCLISTNDNMPDMSEEMRKHSDCLSLEDQSGKQNRILAEKQNVVDQLKTILNLMKNQENLAQKQIAIFQSKIEELEKTTNS